MCRSCDTGRFQLGGGRYRAGGPLRSNEGELETLLAALCGDGDFGGEGAK